MASDLDTVRSSIESAFRTAWAGSATGTPLIDQANHAEGDVAVHLDGLTALPTVGEWFQVEGDPTWYRVTSASALVGTDTDIGYTPAAGEAWPENTAVSFYETPVAWPNVSFTAPDSGAWVRPTILFGNAAMDVAGEGVTGNAVSGLLKVSVFDLPGKGLGLAYDLADVVRTAFSRVKIGAAFFFAPSGPRDASSGTGGQLVVDCPFEVREA